MKPLKFVHPDMENFNPLQDTAAMQKFLRSFSASARSQGRDYFAAGAVLAMGCEVPGHYVATVRGGSKYEVLLDYKDNEWSAECTCPIGYGCKHAVAALLALQANAGELIKPAVAVLNPKGKQANPKIVSLPEAPQPPASPLAASLTAALGRKLKSGESSFVRQIQGLFQQVRQQRPLTAWDLHSLNAKFVAYNWMALQLWPQPPENDFELWLYLAWEFRRSHVAIPPFMETVTDFAIIEPRMKAWEREKAIEIWKGQLAQARAHPPGASSDLTDFRLMIFPEEARVQWKIQSEPEFKDLKQTQLRRFAEQYERGSFAVVSEALPLWSALYKPWDYYTMTNLSFAVPETARQLGRVLRLPGLAERIVTTEGAPLARPTEPLRYALRPAQSAEDDYQLHLTLPEGLEVPPILLTLTGPPPLYLTANAIYTGPPPHGLGSSDKLAIPAPALETADGLNFLDSLEVVLPPRLAARARRVPLPVKITCSLKPINPGSNTEAVFLRVVAEQENGEEQFFTSAGWQSMSLRYAAHKRKAAPAHDDDGTIPVYDRSAQQHFPRIIETLGAKWDSYGQEWRVRLTKNFPEVFLPWLESIPSNVEILLDPALATLRDAPLSGSVRLDVEEAGVDWFDLKVVLNVSDTELTPEELNLLLNARGRFVRLGEKGWRRLQFNFTAEEDERLARLGLSPRDFTAEPQRLHALQLADEAASNLLPAQQVEKIRRRVGELKARVTPDVPEIISAHLRPYQIEGFHFLAYLTTNRFGGVLADDMGLGKTVQTLTWLAWLRAQPEFSKEPSLVVCPKSVMDNWRAEVARFFPGYRVLQWHGDDAATLEKARREHDLLVINYAQLRSLSPEIARMPWHAVILDEAQYIKNPDSQTSQVARALQAEHRLALTGTPIENRLLDLWSILSFAMPGVLGNRAHFTKRFNQTDDPLARRRLAARVRPFLLRRTKNQVAKDLPDRTEEDLLCEMEREQKTLYRAEFKRAQQMLLSIKTKKELNAQRFNFLTSLLRLRQICCHPALVSEELRQAESAKVNALMDLLEPLMQEGHKVLVFSQFVTMLDILRETIRQREWPHFYLAGDTENRGELVQEFQTAKGAAVFLISLKAGGFGLNLTAASYVVLFDPWWNPAVESQAIDRTHRIGQSNKVFAYRLLIKDSIEQKIRQLQKTKAALAEDVLGEETFAKSLTMEDLKFLFAEE